MTNAIRILGVAGFAICFAGCDTSAPATNSAPEASRPAVEPKSVTFHVPEMGERLKLL